MTELERASLKENIQIKIVEIRLKIVALEEATKPIGPENAIGRISRMDAINNKSVARCSFTHFSKAVNQLKDSFKQNR